MSLYDEEDPAIWFRLIDETNTLANLPKQVLRDILDTDAACNKSKIPFDDLKVVLLGQFGKSKWQFYFVMLRLPLGMDSMMPRILLGKLKELLSHSISPDNNLFHSMFLIKLPPSMRKTVGTGNHKLAAAMVKAAGALWEALGGNDPTVAWHGRSPTPAKE